MVGAVGDVAGELAVGRVDRRHERDVGQVRPAEVGVVEDGDVARPEGQGAHHGGDRRRHRSEVDGQMGGLRREAPRGVEDGAGVVPALLDVRREGGAAQRRSHLLGDRGEQTLEDFERDGIHQGVLSMIMFARGP